MKKAIMVMFVAMATQQAFGQSFLKGIVSRLSYGVKAGGNYSNFTNANFDTKGLPGFHAGFLVDFKLTKHLSIQEDFLFSLQGAEVADENLFGKKDLYMTYISVPIVLKYRTRPGIYIEAGAQTGMLVSDAKNAVFGDFANKIDAGVVGGIGYQFEMGNTKKIGIGARYYQGLSAVGQFSSETVKPNFNNNMAQLSVFYVF